MKFIPSQKNADLIFALLLILGALVVLVRGIFVSSYLIQQSSLVLLLASIIYIALRKSFKKKKYFSLNSPKIYFQITSIVFFILLIYSILLLRNSPNERPLTFLIVVSVMAAVLAIESIVANDFKKPIFVLVEILILGILLRLSAFYQFPTLYGGDPWVHAQWIQDILNSGHITDNMGSYSAFPLMHVFSSETSIITDLSIKGAMSILGIIEVLSLVFVFLLVHKFWSTRTALISVLLLIVSSFYCLWGFLITPQTFALAFIPMIIFMVSRQAPNKLRMIDVIIVLLLIIVIVLTHTLSSFACLVILAAIWLIDRIGNILHMKTMVKIPSVSYQLLIFFILFILAYWMYASGFGLYIADSVKWAFSAAYLSPPASTLSDSFLTMSFKWLPTYFLIFFAIIGTLSFVREASYKTIGIYGWIIVLFVAISTFLGLNSFLPGRWFVFIELTMIVPTVIGLIMLSQIFPTKLLALFILVCLFALVNITNYQANITNVNPFTPYPTLALKTSEMVAAKTMLEKTPENVSLYGDYYYCVYSDNNKTLQDGSSILLGKGPLNGTILIRNEVERNVFMAPSEGQSGHASTVQLDPSFWSINLYANLIYSCDTVKVIGALNNGK